MRLPFVYTAMGIFVLFLSLTPVTAEDNKSNQPTAVDLMRTAHEGRAMWANFPGFKARVELLAEGKTLRGAFQVDRAGNATLELEGGAKAEWAERTLRSVVSHRQATDEFPSTVEFSDNDLSHPLGRLIKSTSDADKSLWRVKDDVLTEVHRFGPESHFVITVSDVARNAENKHLPQNFTVTTWNNNGGLKSTRQVNNEWKRVGQFDLPTKLLAINAQADGSRKVEQIELSQLEILPTAATP